MNELERHKVKEAVIALFNDHGITNLEEFESLDEESGAELYEDLKVGVLEEFEVDLELINELTEEILS